MSILNLEVRIASSYRAIELTSLSSREKSWIHIYAADILRRISMISFLLKLVKQSYLYWSKANSKLVATIVNIRVTKWEMLGTSEKTTKYGMTNTHSFSFRQQVEVANINVAKKFSNEKPKRILYFNSDGVQHWFETFMSSHVFNRQRARPSFLKLPYLWLSLLDYAITNICCHSERP